MSRVNFAHLSTGDPSTTRPHDWTHASPRANAGDSRQDGQFTVAKVCYTRNGVLSAVRTVGETRFFENQNNGRAAIGLENHARSGKPERNGNRHYLLNETEVSTPPRTP
ncbi:MAG: hypothetical protein AB7V18_05725 [Pyrinomonadaceae bacterium]